MLIVSRVALTLLVAALLVLPVAGRGLQCQSRLAAADEVPHGANEDILMVGLTVRALEGQVGWSDDAPLGDVVVEVNQVRKQRHRAHDDRWQAVGDRIAARVTGEDGRFCFFELPPGRYLVVLGTKDVRGIQLLRAEVTVNPGADADDILWLNLRPGT